MKLCRTNNIPVPPSGYWTRLNMGKPVEQTPLPDSDSDEVTVTASLPDDGEPMLAPRSGPDEPDGEDAKIGLFVPEPPKGKYDRQTLYEEVWVEPVTKVSKRYGLNDNGLRKICRPLHISLPGRGYWTKLRAGKPVKKVSLPKIKPPAVDKQDLPRTGTERKLQIGENALSFLKSDDREKILMPPGSSGWRGSTRRLTRISKPTKSSYNRAFHILDTLVKALIPFFSGLNYNLSLKVNNEAKDFEATLCIRAYADAWKRADDADAQWLQRASEKADWLDPTVARKDEFFGKRKHANAPEYKDPEKK